MELLITLTGGMTPRMKARVAALTVGLLSSLYTTSHVLYTKSQSSRYAGLQQSEEWEG